MSGLMQCPACGRPVSREAAACPFCGQPLRRSGWRMLDEALGAFLGCAGTVLAVVVLLVAVMVLFGGC